jgi:hypothetical protein
MPIGPTGTLSRPLVDVIVEGLDAAPQACLVDTGATAVRMSAEIAEAVGLDLAGAPEDEVVAGGMRVRGREANVDLTIVLDGRPVTWAAPVWFCEDWPQAFGLLGLRGFLDVFDLTMSGCDETFALTPRFA